jgi:hypothetical protein
MFAVFSVLAPNSIRRSRSMVVPLVLICSVRKASVSSAALSLPRSSAPSGAFEDRRELPEVDVPPLSLHCPSLARKSRVSG